jgi:TrmH family RNA methyltransferase
MEKITKAQVKLIRSLQQKKFRDELGLFVAEGEKCVDELRKGFELVYLVRNEGTKDLRSEEEVLLASAKEIEQMSGLRTPQGVIGVFKKRSASRYSVSETVGTPSGEAGLTLALDGIQDPGNLGTIIRTCDWFGVHDIVCSTNTADCYNPKVVQATMGALARVRVHYTDLVEWLSREEKVRIYGTLLEGENMYEVMRPASPDRAQTGLRPDRTQTIIVMGNEGNGISAEVRKLITHPIRIPSYPPNGAFGKNGKNAERSEVVESLNVSIATAIVLAEFRRENK